MPSPLDRIGPGLRTLIVLAMLLALLAACGGPTPTPIILVVTSTFTPESVVQVVTATFTPAPSVEPTEAPPTSLPTVPPTETPAEAALEFTTYEHPSGVFTVDIPQASDYEEDESGVYYSYSDSLVMVFFTVPDSPLGPEDLKAAIPAIADEALVGQGLISSYSDLEIQLNDAGTAAGANMNIVSEDFGNGEGDFLLWQVDHVLYMMILLTPDFNQVKAVWSTAMDSLTAFPEKAPLPAAPTDTPMPPPPTPKPTAKPTAKPTSPPPPPPATNQGCYLFENQIGAELTVTFTSRDRDWSDSFKIAANGTREYCLDAGSYTYTIDAPPPWGSTNGDLVVNPGDRYRWPIRGG